MLSLPPLEVAETVVGGVFVGVCQRRVVVDRVDKGIDGSAARHDVRSDVNQFRRKLADVMKVQDFREGEYVDRELVLVKVAVDSTTRAEVMQITDIFRTKIVDVQPKSPTIEVTGDESKVDKFLSLMKTFGVLDLTRTGRVAMPRK